jgi:rod shape-determining protein MreC
MQQIVFFLHKYKYFLFFLFLEFIAVALTFNNLNFHKSKFVNSANAITGGLYLKATDISEYLYLKDRNKELLEENTRLNNKIQKIFFTQDSISEIEVIDSTVYNQKYRYINARIEKNDYSNPFNYLTINRGEKDEITSEMAVMNSKGIIGITDNVTNNYARVQSILNKNSKINARLKNSNHFGSLEWDGKNYNIVQLMDIPRQAILKIGDTIETGGKSTIFPGGIPIGTISKINKGNTVDNKIHIKLFNDMSDLGFVYVVKNLHKEEIRSLENNSNE